MSRKGFLDLLQMLNRNDTLLGGYYFLVRKLLQITLK